MFWSFRSIHVYDPCLKFYLLKTSAETFSHYHMWKHRFQPEFQWKSSTPSIPLSRTDNTLLRHGFLQRFKNPTIFLRISCDGDYILPIVVGMCQSLVCISLNFLEIVVLLTLFLCWCRADCYWETYGCGIWTWKCGIFQPVSEWLFTLFFSLWSVLRKWWYCRNVLTSTSLWKT